MISLAPTKKEKKKAAGSNPSWSCACLTVSKQVGRISPPQPVWPQLFSAGMTSSVN